MSPSSTRRCPQPVSSTTGVAGDAALTAEATRAPVDVRHAEVRDHDVERLAALLCFCEGVDARLSAVGSGHFVTVAPERGAQRFEHERIVVDDEDRQRTRRGLVRDGLRRNRCCRLRRGERDPHGRALMQRAVDFQLRAVSSHHAVDHGETEAGAALALGREERLQAAPSRFLVHADAGIRDFQLHGLARSCASARSACRRPASRRPR